MRDLILVLAAALLLRVCAQQVGEQDASAARTIGLTQKRPQAAGATFAREEWRPVGEGGGPALLFQAVGSPPIAGISCEREAGRLRIERVATVPPGGIGTMTVSADNRIRSLPVSSTRAEPPMAAAHLKLEDRMVDSLSRGSGRIELALGGEPLLILPAHPRIGELIAECRG